MRHPTSRRFSDMQKISLTATDPSTSQGTNSITLYSLLPVRQNRILPEYRTPLFAFFSSGWCLLPPSCLRMALGTYLSHVEKALEVDTSALPAPDTAHEETRPSSRDDLPPRDCGKDAWTCLAAISAISMVTWGELSATLSCWTADLILTTGFGAAQGVFREYYFRNPPFEGNQLVASIGLLIVGILQSLSPFLLHLIGSYPRCRVYMMWIGMVLILASSLGAAFSITVKTSTSSPLVRPGYLTNPERRPFR